MKDFTVDDKGIVHGLPPGQFEFGQRYVRCSFCKVQRRPSEMMHVGAEFVSCKDKEVCDRLRE